ncbi:hypothetical protein KY327_02095, partial [Candidatus Woesearchaeota archaeon]|nr:hypothetical protein [Candidatus Woesearchaeota archaeon]
DICGVDILEGPTGPLIIEINISPGLQGITEATKVDVADLIARYLYDKTKELSDSRKDRQTKEIMADLNSDNGNSGREQELITQLDFRGARILLPELVSKLTGFDDSDSVKLVASKGSLSVKRFM